jgi:hypothetical protein
MRTPAQPEYRIKAGAGLHPLQLLMDSTSLEWVMTSRETADTLGMSPVLVNSSVTFGRLAGFAWQPPDSFLGRCELRLLGTA